MFFREVGPKNVAQVITDNATNYIATGKLLMERYPNLFWTPCVEHCIDLMLEDLGILLNHPRAYNFLDIIMHLCLN